MSDFYDADVNVDAGVGVDLDSSRADDYISRVIARRAREDTLRNLADPPYSMAIVAVMWCSVFLQVISQAIIFSVLQLELQLACWMFTYMFGVATCWFALDVVLTWGVGGVLDAAKDFYLFLFCKQ